MRFGDPETQVVLPRLDGDLAGAAGRGGRRAGCAPMPRFSADAAVCVVLASEGYPEAPRTGDAIDGLDAAGGRSTA